MRISRIALFMVLGALLCLLFIYALGRRIEKPAVIFAGHGYARPILHTGQVLTWERPTDEPFTVYWFDNAGPCKSLMIPSAKNASGGQTASCKVENPPPDTYTYRYGIGEGNEKHSLIPPNVTPCWGCQYISANNMDFRSPKTATEASFDPITVSCAISDPSAPQTGSVQFDPNPDQLPRSPNLNLSWNQVGNILIDQPIVFTDRNQAPADVTCDKYNHCSFIKATNYPITYRVHVHGTGEKPGICGPNNSTTGYGTGQVDAPAP